jgi:hypothetical protein
MATVEIAMGSRDTDCSKAIFLKRKSPIVVGNGPGDGEGKLLTKMELPEPEGLSLEFD